MEYDESCLEECWVMPSGHPLLHDIYRWRILDTNGPLHQIYKCSIGLHEALQTVTKQCHLGHMTSWAPRHTPTCGLRNVKCPHIVPSVWNLPACIARHMICQILTSFTRWYLTTCTNVGIANLSPEVRTFQKSNYILPSPNFFLKVALIHWHTRSSRLTFSALEQNWHQVAINTLL